jgi:hypothetical protein
MRYIIPKHLRVKACLLITLDELDRQYNVYLPGGRDFVIGCLNNVGFPVEYLHVLEECAHVICMTSFTVIAYNQGLQDYVVIYDHKRKRGSVIPEHMQIGLVMKINETNFHAISVSARSVWYVDTAKIEGIVIPRKHLS